MSAPQTLFQMAGADMQPASLSEAALVIIDAQNEYTSGPVALPGVDGKIAEIAGLLSRAREAGTPVIHVRHLGRPGGLFDPDDARSEIVGALSPQDGEPVVTKALPNAFAGTSFADTVKGTGRGALIIAGFMTHMCVSATARAALDHGMMSTVVASATGTRDLPDPVTGDTIAAEALHHAALAALSDRFAVIAKTAGDIPG